MSLLGGNASGKSTTLKTILGLVQPRNGTVEFRGEDITGRTTSYRIRQGMAIVPENRRLFGPMTVLENLEMGAYLNATARAARRTSTASTRSSRCCTSGATSSRGRCRAASSRWWRWGAR